MKEHDDNKHDDDQCDDDDNNRPPVVEYGRNGFEFLKEAFYNIRSTPGNSYRSYSDLLMIETMYIVVLTTSLISSE